MKNVCSFILIIFCLLTFFSCKKDSFIGSSDARLGTSIDTLKFDTVFTQAGSVTRSFKIRNLNDQRLRLNSVKLMGGNNSPYKINVNGIASSEVTDIEIAANDSIYVFVSVTVNPDASNAPFIISDSIQLSYNGNQRFVQLQAFGQNANFIRNAVINTNTTWNNSRPYIILGSIRVDTLATLTIEAGTRIYAHADAPFVVDGTLIANGTVDNKIVFAGDRLDEPYKNFPGAWPGIYFRGSSSNSKMTFTNIMNAYQAIVAEQPSINSNAKLVMQQCTIDNAADAGLLLFNSSVRAENVLVTNCAKNLQILLGGNYSFIHCSFVAYSNNYMLHKFPAVSVDNSANVNGAPQVADLNAVFTNSIIWGDFGNVDNEVVVNRAGTGIFNFSLDHCLYKAVNDPSNTVFINSIKNVDPEFDKIDITNKIYDYHTTESPTAPGINKGIVTSVLIDLDNKTRNSGLPDIGTYEKQ